MIKNKLVPLTILFSLLCTSPATALEDDEKLKEYLDKSDIYIKSYRHFEASDALKAATIIGGAKHPSLHMRLGILYYGLGLIPEAIAEGEKAVALAPSSKWYKYDLAKFYYVDKLYDNAEQQFTALLKIDPGFTLGYYYLAQLYFQKQEYDMAWLSLERARLLGHRGKHLEEKLAPYTTKPKEDFGQVSDDNKLFRFIKLPTAEDARKAIAEISNGKLFENLQLQLKKEHRKNVDFGVMLLSELGATISESLRDKKLYSPPVVVQTGPDYRIMQRIAPFDASSWQTSLNKVSETPPAKDVPIEPAKRDADTVASEETTKIIPPAAKAPQQQLSTRLATFYALENWLEAWQDQDVDAYLAAYSNNFTPKDQISIETWRKKRNRSISRPKSINIGIEDSSFAMIADDVVQITFKQSYKSDSYQDEVIKSLTMKKETEGWKITEEKEIQKITP
jgi:tetratricopeptide (TPR) repeat protein